MASLVDINSVSQTASNPATPTRGIGRFGTPRTVFSPVRCSPSKPAACNGDGETFCSSVLLKSVRPLLEKLASQGVADGQHKPAKVHVVADAPDVKRPGIGRFGGKPAAAVLAPVVVPAAPSPSAAAAVTSSAVVAPVVVPEVAPVAPVASTTPQVPEASVTTETIPEEASACAADPSEKARWAKLREEVRVMNIALTRAAYLRWDKRSKEASWAMEIEAAIEAALRPCFLPKHPNAMANLTRKTVPPASAAAAAVAVSAAPAAPSPAATTTVKSPAAASSVRGAAAAAQKPKPAVAARCKVGVESAKGKNGCSSKVVSMGVKGGKGNNTHASSAPCAAAAAVAGLRGAASSVRAEGKASSRHASGVKRREGDGCGEGAAGRAAGGRQGGVKAAGGRAVASGVCGREGVKQQAGRREGLVHERQARPGCSSSRAHRRSS
ncbi:unnamed protein product [Closterium sp. Yama58-4]|nr:unnamed protein product [Closterium sp. Yama58-4]